MAGAPETSPEAAPDAEGPVWADFLLPMVMEKWGAPEPWLRPDGTARVLLFRSEEAARKVGRSVERTSAGLVDVVYQGHPAIADAVSLEEHVLDNYGPGRYRMVDQRMIAGAWRYAGSRVTDVSAQGLVERARAGVTS